MNCSYMYMMVRNRLFFVLFVATVLLPSGALFSQKGKDGALTVSAGGTIVNEYTNLTANLSPGPTTIQVTSSVLNSSGRFSGPLQAGDLIMIYQTWGASLLGSFPFGPPNGFPFDSTQGQVSNYWSTGWYEFAEVRSVINATEIELTCPINFYYSGAFNQTQVIRVPRYSSITITGSGVLTAQAWDGSIGGLLVAEVDGPTINNGSINVKGLGFRGGAVYNDISQFGSNLVGTILSQYGAQKGEGIAGYQAQYDLISGQYGRGAMANGGGGGCALNGGGGGGANAGDVSLWNGHGVPNISTLAYQNAWNLEYPWKSTTTSSGGGKGGYTFSQNNMNATTSAPKSGSWGGDNRNNTGGFGGRPLDYTTGRLFLGGGGGAGHDDNGFGGSGGNGGGMVYLMCFGTITGSGQVIADGDDGGSTTLTGNPIPLGGIEGNDGAGGGGAGGTIILNATGAISGISARANGGDGGDQTIAKNALVNHEAEGPGGGGGGGYIALSNGAIAQTVNGGVNGVTNSTGLTEFPMNGATSGGVGMSSQAITNYSITVRDTAFCGATTVTLTAALAGSAPGGATINWYDAAVAGNIIGTGNTFTTPLLNATTTYYVGTCPGFFREPVTVVISNNTISPTLTVANTNCGATNGSVSVSLMGGTSPFTYVWSNAGTGQTINSVAAATYTVTITDVAGCTSISTAALTDNACSITVTSADLNCSGQNTGTASVTPAGGNGIYTYLWSPNVSTGATASGLAAAIYSVTVTDNDAYNIVTTVTITSPPTLLLTPGSTPANCSSADGTAHVSVTGGIPGYSYLWSNGGTAATISSLAGGSYVVTVTDNNSCTSTTSSVVSSTSGFSASLGTVTDVNCFGASTGSVGVNVSGGAVPYSFVWTVAGTGATQSSLSAGNYSVTVSDNSGCTSVLAFVVTEPVSALSITSINKTDASCGSSNGSADAVVSGGTTGYTYSWSTSATASSISNLGASTYTLTVTDGKGCVAVSTVAIADPGGLTLTPSSVSTTCGSSNGEAAVSVSGGTPSYSYLWSNASAGATIAGLSSGTYTVTVTDNTSCSASTTVSVASGGAGFTASMGTVTDVLCFGTSTGSASVNASSGMPPYSYVWTVAGTGATQTSLPAANYAVTVSDNAGCSIVLPFVITEPANALSLTSASVAASCGANNGEASVSASGGTGAYTYLWSTLATGATLANAGAGSYTVTVTDNNACVQTISVNISSTTGYTAQLGPVTNVSCFGFSDGATSVNTSGGTPPYSYVWSVAGTGAAQTNLAAGNYSVTASDNSGCSSVLSFTITEPPSALTISTVNTTDASCGLSNGSAVAVVSGGTGAYTYTWSTLASGATLVNLPASTYSVAVADANACTAVAVVTINAIPPPVADAGAYQTVCEGSSVTLTGSGGNVYVWSSSSSLNDASVSSPVASPTITTTYTLTVDDGSGCTDTDTVTVKVNSKPVISTSGNSSIVIGASVNLSAAGGTSYLWSPSASLTSSSGSSTLASPTQTTTYTVTVTDMNGCVDEAFLTITVDIICGELFIPKAFSPNNDGVNDILYVRGNCVKELNLEIFNRWGSRVFSANDQQVGWTGEFLGSPVDSGVYAYVLKVSLLNGEKIVKEGNITLLR